MDVFNDQWGFETDTQGVFFLGANPALKAVTSYNNNAIPSLGSFFNRLGRREQQIEVRASDEDAGHKAGPREALPRFLDPLQTLEQFTHGRKARLPRARCQGALDRLKNYTYPTLL